MYTVLGGASDGVYTVLGGASDDVYTVLGSVTPVGDQINTACIASCL